MSARHNPTSVKRRIVNRRRRVIGCLNVAERPPQASLVLQENTVEDSPFAASSTGHFFRMKQFRMNV